MSARELPKRLFFTLVIAGVLAISYTVDGAAQTAGSVSERRVALVIGNANYPYQPLKNPVNDARAMSATLQLLGFEVTLVENATRTKTQQAILDFGEKLADGGVGLFYYAGHGLQVRGNNYLVPIDENIRSEASVRFEAIVLDAVLEEMSQPRPNRVNIVILDACRDNPYASRYGGAGAGLALVDAPVDFFITYAAAPGAVAVDGSSGNGLYTSEIIKAMSLPDLKIEDMFKRVRAEVARKTRHAQVPWEASSLLRDFSFNLPSPPTEAPVVPSKPPDRPEPHGLGRESDKVEFAFWDSIKSSQNAVDYEAYLETFPEGIFASLARARAERYPQGAKPQQKPSGPDVEEIETYFVALAESNLREKPTARSRRVGTISAGERVLATGKVRGANWYRVESTQGVSGYVFGDSIINAEIARAPDKKAARQTPKTVPEEPPKPSKSENLKPPALQPRQEKSPVVAIMPEFQEQQPAEKQAAVEVYPKAGRRPGETFKDCDECPEMVVIPTGRFRMGNLRGGGQDNERPVHAVTIDYKLAVGKFEVTFDEWKACVADLGCGGHRPDDRGWGRGRRPVINVSWFNAKTYVRWLSGRTGQKYRLLSESEWEYVARAGSTTEYPFGNSEDSLCDYGNGADRSTGFDWQNKSCDDGFGKRTAPVGNYRPNAFGIFDTLGNVWEWTEDCWRVSYHGAPGNGEAWTTGSECAKRILRGGSWYGPPGNLRSAIRDRFTAASQYGSLGFRVARTAL